jgi:hypothetical protein
MNRKTIHVLRDAPDHGSPIELTVAEYQHVVVFLVFSETVVSEKTWLWAFNEWLTPIYEKYRSNKPMMLIAPDGTTEWLTPQLAV